MMRQSNDRLRAWLTAIGDDQWVWFAKRLSANDTGLTGGHQVGFYLPLDFALTVAPEVGAPVLNPRRLLRFALISHDQRFRAESHLLQQPADSTSGQWQE